MKDPTIEATIMFALNHHRGQVDRAGQAYILHPLRVMSKFSTEPEQTVAVLHDIIEDTDVTFEYLREGMRYPPEIIEAIDCLTKRPEEMEDYDAYIRRVVAGPILARRVKIEDLKDNANLKRFSIPTADDRRRAKKYRAALRVVRASLDPAPSP